MDTLFIRVPFNKGIREPYAEKVKLDGERMYNHSRYVIVLDELGNIVESFDNPPFCGVVDCLTVLAPYTYRGVYIEKVVMLEIGFRRFVPYNATEYRPGGKPKRTPRVRGKRKEKVNVIPRYMRGHIVRIPKRTPVAKLSEQTQLLMMPELCKGIQKCVNGIIRTWGQGVLQQDNYTHDPMKYSYEVHIQMRIANDEKFLLAAAKFSEIELRFSPGKNLYATAMWIRKYCKEFIERSKRSRTNEGDWLDERVRSSPQASWIAELLKPRIKNKVYSLQILTRLFNLVGNPGSPCRVFLDQVMRIYKIPKAEMNTLLAFYEKRYKKEKGDMLAGWNIRNFSPMSENSLARKHARNTSPISVLGSHNELQNMMKERDKRRDQQLRQQMTQVSSRHAVVLEEDQDADIPF